MSKAANVKSKLRASKQTAKQRAIELVREGCPSKQGKTCQACHWYVLPCAAAALETETKKRSIRRYSTPTLAYTRT